MKEIRIMFSRRTGRIFLKFASIWTLIAAVFTAAYSTGLYLLYKDGIHRLKDEIILKSNSWFHTYHISNEKLLLHFPIEGNYRYFGKIEDDGSLKDIYKTDYSIFQLHGLDDPDLRSMYPYLRYPDNMLADFYLTNDVRRRGSVSSSYITHWDGSVLSEHGITVPDKGEFNKRMDYFIYFLYCPEEVFNKISGSQEKGLHLAKSFIPQYDIDKEYIIYNSSGNDLLNKIYRVWGKAVVFISDHFIHNLDSYTVKDGVDEVYISRADVDLREGKILSGELCVNGEKYPFPTNSNGYDYETIKISLHKRPDSILENNKDLLRDNFDQAYLESLKYQSKSDLYNYNKEITDRSSLEGFTYDYKYEEGQAVISGICKYEDGYYRYVYIIPLAGFWTAYAPDIAEAALIVWIPGMIICGLYSLVVSKKRYV